MKHLSIVHCRWAFGHYGRFAILRLVTAVIRHDQYSLSVFKLAFRCSGDNHEDNPRLREFMESLGYADSEYFSTEELRFLLQIAGSYKKLTDEEIEVEREQIMKSGLILPTHVIYLLKAVDYWKMYYDEKFEEWKQEYAVVNRECRQRRMLALGLIGKGASAIDDGYCSGGDGEEDK